MSLSAEIQGPPLTPLNSDETMTTCEAFEARSIVPRAPVQPALSIDRSLDAIGTGFWTSLTRKTLLRARQARVSSDMKTSRGRLSGLFAAVRQAGQTFGPGAAGADAQDFTGRQPFDLSAFMALPVTRSDDGVKRIVYAGDLSPYGGVADLLSCVVHWAERHTSERVELCWVGTGDLKGVLQAQPLPCNLTQVFTRADEAAERADLFHRCSLLAVPNLENVGLLSVAQGMAAGLPVLGSVRCLPARMLVTAEVNGWLFDPLIAGQMFTALDKALTAPAAQLAEMRIAARHRVSALSAIAIPADTATRWRWGSDLVATGS